MRVLLTGADGMLGRAVRAAAPAGVQVTPTTIATLDITDKDAVRNTLAARFDWIVNCAAYTVCDRAEDEEDQALKVNAEAVGILGKAAADRGTRVLHVSTDYVFDGMLGRPYREDDAPNPINAYGRSKLAGERALASSGCKWTLVRTQWLYGGGPSFVRTMWRRAQERAPVRVVNDQLGAPTHCAELAGVLWRMVQEGCVGVWHAAAGGYTSRYEVARAVYDAAGMDVALVTSCHTSEYPTPARRPLDGRLDTSRLNDGLGGRMRPWDEVVRETLAVASIRLATDGHEV